MPRKTRAKPGPGGPGAHGQRTDLNKAAGASPTQAPAAPTGMAYGAHNDTLEAQRQIPLPAAPPSPAQASRPSPGGGGGPLDALMAAQMTAAPGPGLGAPSARPDEPITAGLSTGPGPGAAMRPQPRAGEFLQRLAAAGGDPDLAELADLARRAGA